MQNKLNCITRREGNQINGVCRTPSVSAGTNRCSFCRKPGHYKPRCEEYKISLVNPVVVNPVVVNPVVVNPVVVNPVVVDLVTVIKRCSFCRMQGHNKTRCEEYKKSLVHPVAVRPVAVRPAAVRPVAVAVRPVAVRPAALHRLTFNPSEVLVDINSIYGFESSTEFKYRINILYTACAQELENYKQKIKGLYILSDLEVRIECLYYFIYIKSSFVDPQFELYERPFFRLHVEAFRVVIINYYNMFFEANKHRFAGKSLKNIIIPRIRLELCTESPKPEFQECGICLSDEIDHSNMVKLNCGHEFCGDCTIKLVDKKPCCAFCRADVKKVCVNSKQCFDLLKATSIFG
jgi:hypothetical protein